jgi:hypothetical protein
VTAHSHARVTREALAAAKLGGIGYHPSLLPRHRGIAAVEWTIKEGDPIAGGTVYTSPTGWMRAPSPRRNGCSSRKARTARELWERALAPLGQKLLATSSFTPRPTTTSLPRRRKRSSPPRRRICPTRNIERYLNTSSCGFRYGISGEIATFFVPRRNRIHLDVFEILGTFLSVASHPSLDTL